MGLYLRAIVAIARSLSAVMASAWHRDEVENILSRLRHRYESMDAALALVLPRHRGIVRPRRRRRMGPQPLPDQGGVIIMRGAKFGFVIAGLDPAIHPLLKKLSQRLMNARVILRKDALRALARA